MLTDKISFKNPDSQQLKTNFLITEIIGIDIREMSLEEMLDSIFKD